MDPNRPTPAWTPDDIDRALAILPVVEAEGFVSHTWDGDGRSVVDGRTVTSMAYPVYHPVVRTLWDLGYDSSAFIDPYAVLPEDPEGTEPGTGMLRVLPGPESMAAATLDQIRRYLVLCLRAERFNEGYIGAELKEGGRMRAALHRLRELRAAMPAP